jgi:hypothetical protein
MIEELDPATGSQTGRYLVVETGAIVTVQFDLDEHNHVVNDQYEVYENTLSPTENGWRCECDVAEGVVEYGDIDDQCIHIREVKKVSRVIFA